MQTIYLKHPKKAQLFFMFGILFFFAACSPELPEGHFTDFNEFKGKKMWVKVGDGDMRELVIDSFLVGVDEMGITRPIILKGDFTFQDSIRGIDINHSQSDQKFRTVSNYKGAVLPVNEFGLLYKFNSLIFTADETGLIDIASFDAIQLLNYERHKYKRPPDAGPGICVTVHYIDCDDYCSGSCYPYVNDNGNWDCFCNGAGTCFLTCAIGCMQGTCPGICMPNPKNHACDCI